jgi:hypothetical protein
VQYEYYILKDQLRWEDNINIYFEDEVTGEWRKLHSEELHILYASPYIIRQIK